MTGLVSCCWGRGAIGPEQRARRLSSERPAPESVAVRWQCSRPGSLFSAETITHIPGWLQEALQESCGAVHDWRASRSVAGSNGADASSSESSSARFDANQETSSLT